MFNQKKCYLMKKQLLFIILIFCFTIAKSQDIKPYYDQEEYRSQSFHRFQISTNYRMFVKDIPIEFEYAAFDTYSIGVFVGVMPSGEYKYMSNVFEGTSYKINIDKTSLIYGVKVKSWIISECFDGVYGELNYFYANIPNYSYQEIGFLLGGQISIFKIAFIDLGLGFGVRLLPIKVSEHPEFIIKGNLGIGLKIK